MIPQKESHSQKNMMQQYPIQPTTSLDALDKSVAINTFLHIGSPFLIFTS